MRVAARVSLGASLALAVALASLPPVAIAAEPVFGQPSATATLGEPITVSSTITGDDIGSVEVLLRLVGHEATVVLAAEPSAPAGTWQAIAAIDVATSALCACLADGQSTPNTHFEYQFRVRARDGSTSLGPIGQAVVTDDRFTWRTFEQDLVRVHWYEGDDAFAQSAAQVANVAIGRASELLGMTLPEPVDLFVYATEDAMRSAVAPNRENVQAEAHPAIDTIFAWIPPDAFSAQFADTTVAHELTHLVFDAATDNPYSGVPRWLNEGVAVYLSEGYNPYWQSFVDAAVADRSLIPLDGLRGLFPSSRDQFYVAYGESVASIDFFIRTYGEPKLWELVRSYARGLTDDEAFTDATGADVAAFNAAWFASLGVDVPQPVGPQPGPPGPSAPPDKPGEGTAGEQVRVLVIGLLFGVAVLLAVLIVILLAQRGRARRPPWA